MYITLWKKQNFSDRRQIHGGQGMRVEGGTSSERVGENFGGGCDRNVPSWVWQWLQDSMHLSKFTELYKKVNCTPCKSTSINLILTHPTKYLLTRFHCAASIQNPCFTSPHGQMFSLDSFSSWFSASISHQNQLGGNLSKPPTPRCHPRIFRFPWATECWKTWQVILTGNPGWELPFQRQCFSKRMFLSLWRENF